VYLGRLRPSELPSIEEFRHGDGKVVDFWMNTLYFGQLRSIPTQDWRRNLKCQLQARRQYDSMLRSLPFHNRQDVFVPYTVGPSLSQGVEIAYLQQRWLPGVFTDKTRIAIDGGGFKVVHSYRTGTMRAR